MQIPIRSRKQWPPDIRLDQRVQHLGFKILETPLRRLQANARCARLIGTLRRECLALLMSFTANHLRRSLHEWGGPLPARITSASAAPLPFPLDLLVKTPEEIVQALEREDPFLREITPQGRVLYERSD